MAERWVKLADGDKGSPAFSAALPFHGSQHPSPEQNKLSLSSRHCFLEQCRALDPDGALGSFQPNILQAYAQKP